jgi:general transcription factor 3C polypeptide 2
VNEEEVPPLTKKQKRGSKKSGDMKEKSTVVKGPRGRPRKKPKEDDNAITTQLKRPKGRSRKIQIEKYVDDLDCNDLYAQDLAVQLPDDSSELLAIDLVSRNAQEHAVQKENGKKQAASACNPAVETPMQGRRLKNRKRARSYSDNISPELLTQNEDMGSSVTNHEIQHNSEQEPAVSDNFSHNGSLGISSPSCLVSNDVALPRVVLCLAHNGKVAWDVKWRPSNACDSKCKHRMGYLAVLLGNGSLEV